jgi:6-phosphogluconolactonase
MISSRKARPFDGLRTGFPASATCKKRGTPLLLRIATLLLFATFLNALAGTASRSARSSSEQSSSPRIPSSTGTYLVYVGTYTEDGSKSKGIYAYRYDAQKQEVTPLGLAAETTNPSWLTIHPSGRFLYAVNEVAHYKGPNSGGLSAFSIDRITGKLTFLNQVASRGADPCYATVDRTGRHVMVANYTGGSVAVFPVLADGRLGDASDVVQHAGHGANPERQEGPHAHSVDLSPDNRFAFVDDLGLDELLVYKFDSAKGRLTPNDPPFARLDPGAGPRHFALHPLGKFAYVLTEMHSTVNVFAANLQAGSFERVQTVSTLPADYKGKNDAAELQIHPSGKFLFASNREHDSIAGFGIDADNGTLTPLGYTPTQGKTPRSFAIDPSGKLLFAANQASNSIVLFQIDGKTGRLTPTGQALEVAAPVCVKFVAVE